MLDLWRSKATPDRADVGHSTDALGILGEVEKLCRENPSLGLAEATVRVFETLRQEGR